MLAHGDPPWLRPSLAVSWTSAQVALVLGVVLAIINRSKRLLTALAVAPLVPVGIFGIFKDSGGITEAVTTHLFLLGCIVYATAAISLPVLWFFRFRGACVRGTAMTPLVVFKPRAGPGPLWTSDLGFLVLGPGVALTALCWFYFSMSIEHAAPEWQLELDPLS
jgi:hypothetical protein